MKAREFILDKRSNTIMWILEPCPWKEPLEDYKFVEKLHVIEKSAYEELKALAEEMAGALENGVLYLEGGAGCESDSEIDMAMADKLYKALESFKQWKGKE